MKLKKNWVGFLLVLLLVVGMTTAVSANINGATGYTIHKSSVAGGGHQANTNSLYSLAGTIGQATAKTAVTTGDYLVSSGFWAGGHSNASYHIYLPAIIR